MKHYRFQKNKRKLVEELRAKYSDYLDGSRTSLRSRLQLITKSSELLPANDFNKMLFTEPWIKFKTFFGHKKAEIDPEDNLRNFLVFIAMVKNPFSNLPDIQSHL